MYTYSEPFNYDKYACMRGMIYLAKEWQFGGYVRLKELFDHGYHGFARSVYKLDVIGKIVFSQ